MAEKLTVDRLELLLEEMEPSEIRALHARQLSEDPQLERFLASFEGLDQQLSDLKILDPTPVFRRKPRSIMSWALPLAAAMVFGLLWVAKIPLGDMVQNVPISEDMVLEETVSAPVASAELPEAELAAELPEAELSEPEPAKPEHLAALAERQAAADEKQDEAKSRRSSGISKLAMADDRTTDRDLAQTTSVALEGEAVTSTAAMAPAEEQDGPADDDFGTVADAAPASLRGDAADAGRAVVAELPETREARKKEAMSNERAPWLYDGEIKGKDGSALSLWWQDFHEAWTAQKELPEGLFAQNATYTGNLTQNFADISATTFLKALRAEKVRFEDPRFEENTITLTLIRSARTSKLTFEVKNGRCSAITEGF